MAQASEYTEFQTIHTKTDVSREEWESILGGTINPGFQIENISKITNQHKAEMFSAQCNLISQQLGGSDPNVISGMFHTPNINSLEVILDGGFDIVKGNIGFYGIGIYVTDDMFKASTYSTPTSDPSAIRTMFICSIVLGRNKEYPTGYFDRDLRTAPTGFHSVKGFIRHGFEYVVYNNNQILITHMITYKYTQIILLPLNNAGPAPNGFVVLITSSLSEFFNKLYYRVSTTVALKNMIRENITLLLQQRITVEQFVKSIETILKSTAPQDLVGKIKAELVKCNLQPNQSMIPIGQSITPFGQSIVPAIQSMTITTPPISTILPTAIVRANTSCVDESVCADDEADGYEIQNLRRSKRIHKNNKKDSE